MKSEELLKKRGPSGELDLKGAALSTCDLHKADLKGAVLVHADLRNSDLSDANLADADLTGANLSGANLLRASLNGARLWHADLSFANLTEADLTNAELSECNLAGARLWRTKLSGARFLAKKNFASRQRFPRAERIDEKSPEAAEEGYRELKRYFLHHGRYDDASWASYREKLMDMRCLLQKKDISFVPSFLMNILCGYGEIPHRVVLAALGIVFLYAGIFAGFGSVLAVSGVMQEPLFLNYLYFSVVTFTTVGYGDLIPASGTLPRLLACSEAFLGIFVMGLFIFTLGRRYSAR